MTNPTHLAAGFFRFPARVTTRVAFGALRAARAERIERQAARALFRLRHSEAESLSTPPLEGRSARITVRV